MFTSNPPCARKIFLSTPETCYTSTGRTIENVADYFLFQLFRVLPKDFEDFVGCISGDFGDGFNGSTCFAARYDNFRFSVLLPYLLLLLQLMTFG
jgi:hypothetical protein